MRRREMRALSLALTASIVISGTFTGVDVFAAEKNNEVVRQMVVETSLEENSVDKEDVSKTIENEPAAIVSPEELEQRRNAYETKEESNEQTELEDISVDTIEKEVSEENLNTHLAANSDLVSTVITDSVLLNALIQQVKPGASASDFTYGDLRSYSGELDLGNVTFTSIPQDAFSNCSFSSITLPDRINSIGKNAFDACLKLEHVNTMKDGKVIEDTLPSGLNNVGIQVFQQCVSLKKIVFPNLADGEALGLATAMFYGCTSLCDVTFGDNIKFIPSDAFHSCGTAEGCEGMRVQFGTGLVKIMDKAFIGTKQTGTIDLSQCTKLTEIGATAFKEVDGLICVKLPEKTDSLEIGAEAFACPNDKYEKFLTTMGSGSSPKEGKIVLPEYVTKLGAGCFYGNTSVTSVQISSNVPYIGEYTFDGCKNLTDIIFTNNKSEVTYIGDCAFRNTLTDAGFLQYLTKLKIIGSQHVDETTVKNNNDAHARSIGSLALGGQNTVVDDNGQKKNNEGMVCGSEVFTNCVNIKNITLPASVEEVGSRAFYFSNDDKDTTSNIKTITWKTDGDSNTKRLIYSEAFKGNQNMTEMILPANNNQELEIQAYAFGSDVKLEKLTVDGNNIFTKSLKSIDWGAFYQCESLKKIVIQDRPDGTSPVLGKKAFEGCLSLSDVTLPTALKEIPLRCFANCNLTKMPAGLKNLETIGELSFYGNPFVILDLSELVNVTRINGSAFAYLDLLADQDREESQYNQAIERTVDDLRLPTLTTVILPDKTKYKEGASLFLQSGMFAGQLLMTTMKTPSAGESGKVYIPDYMIQSGYGILAYTAVSEVVWEADNTGRNQWTTIPLQMYQGCWKIQNAEAMLPKGGYVENLGKGLFNHSSVVSADLSGYESLKIIGSGTGIGIYGVSEGVFGGCNNLSKVILPEKASFTIGEYSFAVDLPVDGEEKPALQNVSLGGATEIGMSAFYRQSLLPEICITESVTTVKDRAFCECTNLAKVTFKGNNSLKTIEGEAFSNCRSLVLTDSKLLDGPESIGVRAFYDCDALGTVSLGEQLTSIGNEGFSRGQWDENMGVKEVDFSKAKNLQIIGANAFAKTPLEKVEVSGTKVSLIELNTFYDCQKLQRVVFGKEIEFISDNALAGCCELQRIELSPTTTISNGVFQAMGTNPDAGYTAQKNKNLTIKIVDPSPIVVPLGREMDLPFYTTINDTTKSSYAWVVMENSDSADAEALKVHACLTAGCYKNNTDVSNKLEAGDFYESLQKPYTISINRAGMNRNNIETIRLEGLKATTKPLTLTLKGERSFKTDDNTYNVNIADYGVSYQVSVGEKPVVPVLYSDSEKTMPIPNKDDVMVPMNISDSTSVLVYYNLEDTSGSGEKLDTSNIVVETSDASVLYPVDSSFMTDSTGTKCTVVGNDGSGVFFLVAVGKGTATIKTYPEGYPQYANQYTYRTDSYIQSVSLVIPQEYNKANIVGTEFNIFESYTNFFNQTVNKENLDKYAEYSGFSENIQYTSAEPEYVSVDNKGNVKILQADAEQKTVRITVTYPKNINGDGIVNDYNYIDIQIAGNSPSGDNPSGDNPSGDNPSGDNPSGDNPSGGNPSGDNPSGDNPSGDNPSGGNPSGDNPSGGNSSGGNTTGGTVEPVVELGKEMQDASSGATVIPTIVGKGDLEGEVRYVMPASVAATEVVVPDTVTLNGVRYKVTDVDVKAFKGNTRITAVTLGQYVTKIGAEAFSGCTALKKIVIPASVTRIENKAFYNCSKLAKVTIPSNSALVDIGDSAFYNCKALTSITIPKKVTTIQAKAFYNCKKLKKITIKSTVLKNVGKNAFKNIHSKATIKVPKSKLSAYKKLLKSKGQKKSVKIKK